MMKPHAPYVLTAEEFEVFGQTIVTQLPCVDAADHATCVAGVANGRSTNGCHAHV
jgi:hypothetical protein